MQTAIDKAKQASEAALAAGEKAEAIKRKLTDEIPKAKEAALKSKASGGLASGLASFGGGGLASGNSALSSNNVNTLGTQ